MSGWIKLHRKIRTNPIFNDLQLYRLWTICLLEASHKQREQPIGKQLVQLEIGQFVTGRFDLHGMYNDGLPKKDRVTEYTVWRWLLSLEKQGFISIKSSNKFSIITVQNWSLYQFDEQQIEHQNEQEMSNKRATNEQQMSTNKNVKNLENLKNEENINPVTITRPESDDPYIQILESYCTLHKKGEWHLSQKQRDAIHSLLHKGITAAFVIDSMNKIRQMKIAEDGQQPNSFTFYFNQIVQAWETVHATAQEVSAATASPSNVTQFRRSGGYNRKPQVPIVQPEQSTSAPSPERVAELLALAKKMSGKGENHG